MKLSRIKYNIISIVLFLCFCVCFLIGNVFYAKIKVAVIEGSYADNYAKQKNLSEIELDETEKNYFDIRYETFQYNNNDDGTITIEKYTGISDKLVIPEKIDGKNVYGIGSNFFKTLSMVRDIYLPSSLSEIEYEQNDDNISNITFHCFKTCEYFILNPEIELNIDLMNDSEYINFSLGNCEFRYNDLGQEIEIVGYRGKDSNIVIPSYINGKPVTTVKFNMLGKYNLVVFPETVTKINGITSMFVSSDIWACAALFLAIAFIANMISINIVFSRIGKEIILTSSSVIVTYLYLIIQGIYSCFTVYKRIGSLRQTIIVSVVLFILFIILFIGTIVGRNHSIEVDKHIEQETKNVKYLKSIAVDLSNKIDDEQLKNTVHYIEEEIKYMPLKADNAEIIISLVESLKKDIESGNVESINKKCNDLKNLLKN